VYDPIPESPLYNPLTARHLMWSTELRERFAAATPALPAATSARRECVTFPHQALLADTPQIEQIAAALAKVAASANDIPDKLTEVGFDGSRASIAPS
jgi:hypothetical protein